MTKEEKRYNLKLPKEMYEKLRTKAFEERTDMAVIVRKALKKHLKDNSEQQMYTNGSGVLRGHF